MTNSATLPEVKNLDQLSLYYKDTCPFCQKVLDVMNKLNLNIKRCSTFEATHLEALTTQGGRRQVPCLLIESDQGNVWLYESEDIINYLTEMFS